MSDTETETTQTPDTEPEQTPEPTIPDAPTTEPTPDEMTTPDEGDETGVPADPGEQPAEPTTPDTDTDGDEQNETVVPPAQPAPPLSEKEIEKRMEKLANENRRHVGRVSEIMEESATDLIPCPVCMDGIAGLIYPPEVAPLTNEQRDRMFQLLGLDNFEATPQAEWAQTCATCAGHGEVKTGSRVQGRETTTCLDCSGAGWINLRDRAPANGNQAGQDPSVTGPTVYESQEPDPAVRALQERGYTVIAPFNLHAGN